MRILCVEDDPRDADLVRRALLRSEPPPQDVQVVPTLEAARGALSEPERFDLVITDLALPDGNGLELIAEIRQRRLPLAVVVLTSQGDEAGVVSALKAGANDYLPKADDMAERVGGTARSALAAFRADSALHAQPLRVLYVEHNTADVDLTRRHLAAHAANIQLEWVPDSTHALARLAQAADSVDVLLLDFRLAGDNGLDLLKQLRQDHGLDLPVVLVTGQGSEEVAALAMRLGATDYLVKRNNYLLALPSLLESAFHRVQATREQAALRQLNASLERKVTERTAELEAAKQAAESANLSKSAFLARMSHDLRTPLNAVLGFSELLAVDPVLAASASALRRVGLIHDAGRHLLEMIDEVLDLARIEAGGLRLTLEAVDAGQLVQESMRLVDALAAQLRVTLTQRPTHGSSVALADRTRLRQVLVNLISNAVKFNHAGGRVEVEVAGTPDGVKVAVVDDGQGMTPEQLAALFQPFNRLGAERSGIEGTGLGLVIAKQLVDAMQGRLTVCSTPGRGSTFTLTLPVSAAAAVPEPAQPWQAGAHLAPGLNGPRRVLYVEDNAVNRALMQEVLLLEPAVELQMAADGPSALALAAQWQPQLVLLDLDLPGMSGFELLQRLHGHPATAAVPCVAVSAFAMDREIQSALDQGCVAYLTKPFVLARLIDLIDRHTR